MQCYGGGETCIYCMRFSEKWGFASRVCLVLQCSFCDQLQSVDGEGLIPAQRSVKEIRRNQTLPSLSTKGASGCPVLESHDEVLRPPSIKDLDFLDQEAHIIVQQEVGVRFGNGRAPNVPSMDEYEDMIGKRVKRSDPHQVISGMRTQNAQLYPREYSWLLHVKNPIKFDDLDLRFFLSGESTLLTDITFPWLNVMGVYNCWSKFYIWLVVMSGWVFLILKNSWFTDIGNSKWFTDIGNYLPISVIRFSDIGNSIYRYR